MADAAVLASAVLGRPPQSQDPWSHDGRMAGRPWCPGGTALGRAGAKRPSLTPPLPIAPRRGVGCIHYEMATGRPLFPGSTVKEELHLIFRLLGQSPAAPTLSPPGGARTPSSPGSHRDWEEGLPLALHRAEPPPLSAPTSFIAPFPVPRGPGPSLCPSHALISPGTPTEETWPGVMALSEFRAYNFPRYLPQPLISHAPR